MHLGSLVQLVLIGLTLWIVWQFVVGDIAHPMGFLSSVGVFPTEFDLFKPFASVPTFGAQGLMSVYLWLMYYITGVAVYLSICAFTTTICIWTTGYAAGFTSPSAMTNLTSRPNHSQAESTDLSHAGIELHTDKLRPTSSYAKTAGQPNYKLKVDLSTELARLLNFTATVAIAIRMYSAYNSSGARHEDAPNDLMWLSDSLHNFDMLGNAILAGIPENILFACDSLIKALQSYQEVFPGSTRQAKPTFERNSQRVELKEAIAIFTDIRAKVLPLAKFAAHFDISEAGVDKPVSDDNHSTAEGYKFQVMRGDELANKLASYDDVSDFLDGCSIMRGSQEWHAAFAGVPIQVDGTTMRFIRIGGR
ncbi:hypothetical protein [Janthinobacterium sp. CAN_S7]|uniref:hypothetical protein n=1 Tax=Janthinobacterium sp. CAN_S7 TaxID=3071704 RepID=UPI00319E2FE0